MYQPSADEQALINEQRTYGNQRLRVARLLTRVFESAPADAFNRDQAEAWSRYIYELEYDALQCLGYADAIEEGDYSEAFEAA